MAWSFTDLPAAMGMAQIPNAYVTLIATVVYCWLQATCSSRDNRAYCVAMSSLSDSTLEPQRAAR